MRMMGILDVCLLNDETVKEYKGTKKYIATGDVDKSIITNYTEVYFSKRPSRANREVEIGDILLAKMKDTNKVLLINEENKNYIYSTGFFTIKPKEEVVLKEYIYYLLKSSYFQMKKDENTSGATQKALNNQGLKKINIPVPSIEKQKQIISVIQALEDVITKRKQQIEALSALKQSVFFDMFDTVSTNKYNFKIDILGNYTTLVTSGSTPRGGAKSYLDEGIPLIRSQNVLWNEFDISDVAYIAEETHESMRRSQLNNKDVLFNITGASIGRCSVYEGDNNSANVNQHVCIIRLNDKINPYYLSYFLTGIEFQKNVVSKNIGATRQAFNYTQIKNFNLLIPDISLQNEFEAKVKQIDASISSAKESLMQLNSLSDALLHKAFNGELFKEEIEA